MQQIRHILWDLDGIFFCHDDGYQQTLHRSLARHIADRYDLDFDTALMMADEGQATLKSCFTPFLERYQLNFETLAQRVYAQLDIGFMKPQTTLGALLSKTGTTHSIITKSNLIWTRRVLEQVQLSSLFPDAHITACAEFPDFNKAASPAPYEYTLHRHGFRPEHTAMVEDSQKNLKHAKALDITTILVNSIEAKADYTDHVFTTPEDFLKHFIQQRQS